MYFILFLAGYMSLRVSWGTVMTWSWNMPNLRMNSDVFYGCQIAILSGNQMWTWKIHCKWRVLMGQSSPNAVFLPCGKTSQGLQGKSFTVWSPSDLTQTVEVMRCFDDASLEAELGLWICASAGENSAAVRFPGHGLICWISWPRGLGEPKKGVNHKLNEPSFRRIWQCW